MKKNEEAASAPTYSSRLPAGFRLLRLELELGWENAPYNQFSLPLASQYDITFVTYFSPPVQVDGRIRFFAGGGTLRGYWKALRTAVKGDLDLVHAHTPHVGSFYLVFRALLGGKRVPRVFTVHNSYPNFKLRNKLLLLPVFLLFDRIVCCGQASLESFPPLYRFLAGSRLLSIPNGIDLARIDRVLTSQDRYGPGADTGRTTWISVGRLIPIKNVETLLRAFARTDSSLRLKLVGDGVLRSELMELGRRLGLEERIEFVGRVSRDQVYSELASADAFVSASYGEGLPVAVLEAMACGCPMVLSDIPPHREVAEGTEISLVRAADVDALAARLRHVNELSLQERRQAGRRLRESLEDRFSLHQMLGRYEEVFAELAS